MRLRTFMAPNMREAIASVHAEMGVEAVIVSSQRTRGGVLVRAALEETEEEAGLEEVAIAFAKAVEAECAAPVQQSGDGLIRLRTPAQSNETDSPHSFTRAQLLEILRGHRMTDALAHALAEAAEKTGLADMTLALASALDGRMCAAPVELPKTRALFLTGPYGAGKTAVAAKLAAHAREAGRAVTLIAGDARNAGAVVQLKGFAEVLGVPFAVAESAEQLSHYASECAAQNRLAIIDSAGFDPRNAKARAAFSALAKIRGLETAGVVSACGDAAETEEIVAALGNLGARRLIVTGLDLARRLGALAAAAATSGKLAHVTRSPCFTGALETLTPLALARALIEGTIK